MARERLMVARSTLRLQACPVCSHRLSKVTSIAVSPDRPVGPRAGDVTKCAYCQAILAFTPTLDLRLATAAEFAQLPAALQTFLTSMTDPAGVR